MRLKVTRSKNAASLYVIRSTYENGVHSSKIVEKLGTYADLKARLGDQDPYEWAKAYVAELTRKEKEGKEPAVTVTYAPDRQIAKDERHAFHGGYLFLQCLYYELGLDHVCAQIAKRHEFRYDLNAILSRLLYTRVLFPGSKRSCCELSGQFIEPPGFDLHQVYRALDVLDAESDFIQAELYRNSVKLAKRNTRVLYYDCTNYYFEIERDDELRKYGHSKEHRPNPIVQMGLFMDGDGIPLAFSINPGNTNEQRTLKPLEKTIISDFGLSRFVVCTDAGLSSAENRAFNSLSDRAYVVTQSLKTLPAPVREWALEPLGWRTEDGGRAYDLRTLDGDGEGVRQSLFYKEQWVEIKGIRQRMVVTFSPKYRDYQRSVRGEQVHRALKAIQGGAERLEQSGQNDFKRFIKRTHCTQNGEMTRQTILSLDQQAIDQEAAFDGFYAVCTNLSDDAPGIIRISARRWEIEECFRMMKSEFKARPVYLSLEQRIRAHFMTCFLSLVLFRHLEKRLSGAFTCQTIIRQLQAMMFQRIKGSGYIPCYTRTDLTDALHEAFGFRTDSEIVSDKALKRILKASKSAGRGGAKGTGKVSEE